MSTRDREGISGTQTTGASWIGRDRREWLLLAAVLVLATLPRLLTLGQPLVEVYPFRQTQTAYTALLFHEQGIDLWRSQLPVLGPPFEAPFEFPVFQALAALVMDIGVAPDVALRLTGLACFLLTSVALWLLVRRISTPVTALLAVAFFVCSPFGLLWSRTSLIEYLATAASLWFVVVGMAWRDRPGMVTWIAAVVLGAVAMTVKITTGVFWILPLLAYRPAAPDGAASPGSIRRTQLLGLGGMLAIPIVAGLGWTVHADQIKAQGVFTAWLTSSALQTWNFGTLAERRLLANWLVPAQRIASEMVGLPFLLLLLPVPFAVARSRQRLAWLTLAGVVILPIATLFNLYVVHDYYLAAVSPAVAALLGLGAAWVWEHRGGRVLTTAIVVGAVAFATLSYSLTFPYWSSIFQPVSDPANILPQAAELAAVSQPGDRVIVQGRDWSPVVLYYARREGLAVPNGFAHSPLLASLPADGYRFLSLATPAKDPMDAMEGWTWIGAVGAQTYVLGSGPSDLHGASLLATNDPAVARPPAGATPLLGEPLVVACTGVPTTVPTGRDGTWIELAGTDPKQARLWVVDGLAPVPARPTIVIDKLASAGGSGIPISCSGTPSITISQVYAAAPPS